MKRRNPPPSRGLLRLPRPGPGDSRTPGRILADIAVASPLTGAPKMKLLEIASRALAAERRAGLWSKPR